MSKNVAEDLVVKITNEIKLQDTRFDKVTIVLTAKDGARKLSTARGINFLGEIPIEEEIANSGERRKSIAAEQKSAICLEFKEIAKKNRSKLVERITL